MIKWNSNNACIKIPGNISCVLLLYRLSRYGSQQKINFNGIRLEWVYAKQARIFWANSFYEDAVLQGNQIVTMSWLCLPMSFYLNEVGFHETDMWKNSCLVRRKWFELGLYGWTRVRFMFSRCNPIATKMGLMMIG